MIFSHHRPSVRRRSDVQRTWISVHANNGSLGSNHGGREDGDGTYATPDTQNPHAGGDAGLLKQSHREVADELTLLDQPLSLFVRVTEA
jgi:hypothetical protein